MTAVLVSDDRVQVREGLARVLLEVAGFERADCVGNSELLGRYTRHPTDVVLVGIHRAAPGGVNAVRSLVRVHHQATVIVFGSPGDARDVAAAVIGGAAGFLRWDGLNPPRTISARGPAMASVTAARPDDDERPRLTTRESQILICMSDGHTAAEIARELFLSVDTIKHHIGLLFRKLAVKDRAGAVGQGFRHELLH